MSDQAYHIEPYEWDVVVVGSWNRAILTPAWIATRLFNVAEGNPVSVEVDLQALGPPRVREAGLIVAVSGSKLFLATEASECESLVRAMGIARMAMQELPVTPLRGAGYNIKYRVETPPEALARALAAQLDDALVDEGYRVEGRGLYRRLLLGEGEVNLKVELDGEAACKLTLNFHRQSTDLEELCGWLTVEPDALQGRVESILRAIGLQPGVAHVEDR